MSLRVSRRFYSLRKLLGRADAPEMQEHDAGFFAGHVIVNRHDVDLTRPQRLEHALKFAFKPAPQR